MPPDAVCPAPVPLAGGIAKGGVLVIDDSPLQNLLLCRQLASLGVRTRVLEDPADAAPIIAAAAPSPACVMIELLMRGVNGFEEGRRLMDSFGLPCVLMTATGRKTDRQWARNLGFAHTLGRPAPLPVLRRMLMRLNLIGTAGDDDA